jgi:hypothetical protein
MLGLIFAASNFYLQYSCKPLPYLFEVGQKELRFLGSRQHSFAEESQSAGVASRDGEFTIRDYSSYNSMYAEESKDSILAIANDENSSRTS